MLPRVSHESIDGGQQVFQGDLRIRGVVGFQYSQNGRFPKFLIDFVHAFNQSIRKDNQQVVGAVVPQKLTVAGFAQRV
jgi:hypothetical protein